MWVKATERCFRGGRLRQPGEKFDYKKVKAKKDLPEDLVPVDPPEGAKEEPSKGEE